MKKGYLCVDLEWKDCVCVGVWCAGVGCVGEKGYLGFDLEWKDCMFV